MSDIVLKLPIQPGLEAQVFGTYLNEFMTRGSRWADRLALDAEAPFVMIRADPVAGEAAKVLIFQEGRIASAFYSGWTRRRTEMGVA